MKTFFEIIKKLIMKQNTKRYLKNKKIKILNLREIKFLK